MPDRHGPLKTGLFEFVASVNSGGIAGGAVAVAGWKSIPGGEATLDIFEGQPTVPGDQIGLFVPVGAIVHPESDAGVEGGYIDDLEMDDLEMADVQPLNVDTGKFLVTIPGISVERETYRAENPALVVDAGAMFPPKMGFDPRGTDEAEDRARFLSEYVPGVDGAGASDLQVLVPNGREFVDRHGPMKMPDDARTIEPGETVDLGNMVIAGPADQVGHGYVGKESELPTIDDVRPMELGGASFGLSALATPSASVANQEANPLVGEPTAELLQRDAARRMLRRAGVTDAEEVEWLAGPERTGVTGEEPFTSLLGSETELEVFRGVVSGEDTSWSVAVFVARATPDDHVIAAATIRRSVLTVDGRIRHAWPKEYVGRAAEFAAECIGRLERRENATQ